MLPSTDALKRRVPSAGALGGRPHITRLLVELGFQPERVMRTRWVQRHDANGFNPLTQRRRGRCESFWTRHEGELHDILLAWQRVKALFARKGVVWIKGQ
jgi:hypothetical protein